MVQYLITNIGMLATPLGTSARRGAEQGRIRILRDAWILVEDGKIAGIGTGEPPLLPGRRVDAGGKLVTPGLVDAHTHLIFGGWRQNELGLKLHGVSYLEILARGGGILSTVKSTREASEESLLATARKLLGTPYMWGGASIKHFDCSGFTQFVYRQAGIVLPRNAREQIFTGEEIPYDFAQMRPGDLLFYGTPASPGRRMVVSHVAMYFGDRKIIHSSQLVRISSLTPDGEDFYDRQPLAVRRILGHVDDGSGIRSVAARPWFF